MHASLRNPNRLLLVALALGLAADALFHGRALGLSVPIFVAAGLAALLWLARAEDRPPATANLWLGGSALLFAAFVALRDSPALTWLNLFALIGLLLLFAMSFRTEPVTRLSEWRAALNAMVATVEIAFYPAPLAAAAVGRIGAGRERGRAIMPVVRGLLLAAPVLFVFTALLAFADSVFAAMVEDVLNLDLPFDLGQAFNHALFAGAAGWLVAGGLLVALREHIPMPEAEMPNEGDTLPLPFVWRPPLGAGEALTVLVAVNLLFASFMLVQGAYLFGGLDTLERSGMTYAEYARRGFFELVLVAFLTLGLLWTLGGLTWRETHATQRAFNAACAAMVALVLGMLASAFQRMQIYQMAYGFTELRVYVPAFMIWLAAVLVLFVAALFAARPRLFIWGAFVAGLACMAALNLANPDALIARANIERYQTTGDLDAYYLNRLSADAMPEIGVAIPWLPPEFAEPLVEGLTQQRERVAQIAEESGWPAWNYGRASVP
jgi:hypothetical protein